MLCLPDNAGKPTWNKHMFRTWSLKPWNILQIEFTTKVTKAHIVFNIHIYIYAYGALYIDMPLVFESSRASRLHFASPRYCLPGALPAEWLWGARLPAGAGAQGGALGMGVSQKWAKFGVQNRSPNPNSPLYLDHLIDLSIHHTSITYITLMGDGTSWLMYTGVESLFVELCVVDGL